MLQHALRSLSLSRIMSYYAVARGHEIGVYETWAKAEQQVKGYKGAVFKKFPTRSEAETFVTTKKAVGSSYTPKDVAVPLGGGLQKGPPSLWKKSKNDKMTKTQAATIAATQVELDDFWPASDGDTFQEDELSDADMLAAMSAFEGETSSASTKSLKRKANEPAATSCASKVAKMQSRIWQPVSNRRIAGSDYALDEEGYVIVYTDGSCFNNGCKNACAGFGVYFNDDHPRNMSRPVKGRVTNNVGEIQAAIHAIKVAHEVGIEKLCISTDSQFLIKSITWMKAWKRKNWRLQNGEPVKNEVDFKELDLLLQQQRVDVKWNYVKAHKGIKGNEMADRLAREGSNKYRACQMNHKLEFII